MSFRRSFGILFTYTGVTVLPQLISRGTNIVTQTYAMGALRLWHGQSPYPAPTGVDLFKYSPWFGVLYLPFAGLPDRAQAAAWGVVNAAVFWAGVCRWFRLPSGRSIFWLGWILCAMELDGALRYQQINPLLVGMALGALADFRDGDEFRSGFWLGTAADFKVLPGLFAIALPWTRRRAIGLIAAGLVAVAGPALVVGVSRTLSFHRDWLELLAGDAGGPGLRDLATALAYWGFPATGLLLRRAVLAITVAALVGLGWGRRLTDGTRWALWIAFGLEALLLVSPRTESPTFVLLSPCYLFLLHAIRERSGLGRSIAAAVFAAGAFLVTFSFNDLWPHRVWDPAVWHGTGKTLGVFLLWGLTAVLLARGASAAALPTLARRKLVTSPVG
jgi:hypothetical protein